MKLEKFLIDIKVLWSNIVLYAFFLLQISSKVEMCLIVKTMFVLTFNYSPWCVWLLCLKNHFMVVYCHYLHRNAMFRAWLSQKF